MPLNETVLGIAAAYFPHYNFDANLVVFIVLEASEEGIGKRSSEN